MNVVAGDEIYSTHVHVYVCVVQKADEVACEACAALFSHLFSFYFIFPGRAQTCTSFLPHD